MKKYILFWLVFIFGTNLTWWALSIPYDCWVVNQEKDRYMEMFESLDNDILSEAELELAYDNLKDFCCSKSYLEDDCDSWESKKYPESPYLYDHIVDIWFRKLDWEEELLYDWVELDEKWQERREEIRELANSEDIVSPQVINNTFDQYWDVWWSDWMYRKYQLLCKESWLVQTKVFSIFSDDTSVSELTNACNWMLQDRVDRELTYVKSLMNVRWDHFMTTNLINYTDKYFARNRWISLLEKLVHFEALLLQVTKKVNEWTPQCSG